ncbi:DUF2793 domain-containing protein [Altererythrobacter sp. H2]|uniref:DUF2793 domain-containing protein n=1 Tax=Altererythrobacter sp. H2 TaxID=3108391 RepID=UPI002B4C04E0|nr:DUF2793 domain-containing protein [Altererythrobacter sp. H2]WRK96327.1 DUF2793 domain-containing protein [Altererythrobacter sp. H2]
MPEPLAFPDASPRHALPYLFAGQAQKELHVNEALARLDLLVHPRIMGIASDPPVTPQPGECWLIGPGATGLWSGKADSLAGWTGADWLFVAPHAGMRVWDEAVGQSRFYRDGWQAASAPPAAAGGETVDAEARSAINALIAVLAGCGIFPQA